MVQTFNIGTILSALFGVLVIPIGILNTFWGNDPGYGIFLLVLSFGYFPAANTLFKSIVGRSIPVLGKILLGFFIIMSALGVGELFYKIELMMMSFQ